MKIHNHKNLTGKILISTPNEFIGEVFYRSLVYILSHANDGSVGLIINQMIKSLPLENFIKQEGLAKIFNSTENNLNSSSKSNQSLKILLGGTHEMERMFFFTYRRL